MSMLIGMMMTAAGVALLGKVLKESIRPATSSMKGARNCREKVIEIEEYELIDENQNRPSDSFKVEIQD